jgi:hypothetical protein
MATIARELYGGLVTVRDMLNTVAALLQRIDAERQNCIHKLDVMAGIQLPAQLSATPLPALASTNLVQSPLETMDALPTVTEPPLLPTPTAATGTFVPPPLPCTPSPQPVVWLEPPPTEAAGTIEVGDGRADVAAFNPDWIGNGSTDTQFFGSDHELLFPAQFGLSRPGSLRLISIVCLVSYSLAAAPGTGCSRSTLTASWRQGGTHHRRCWVHTKSAQYHRLLCGIEAKSSLGSGVKHCLHAGFFTNTRV